MKIRKIQIYGYGKWVDQFFSLPSDLHVFYGQNEAGKSTLVSFIHSIFFGFPTRHSSSLRYEPKDSSRYGGKITVEDTRFGQVEIERVDGKATGDVSVTLEDGTVGSEELLQTVLSGVDRELYQSLFSFRLKDLENVDRLTKEELNRYFLSAGALGSESFLLEADRLETQANKLYKRKGRVPEINQKLKKVDEKQRKVNQAKQKNNDYLQMVKQSDQFSDEINTIEQEKNRIEQRINELTQATKEWQSIEEIRKLDQEIKNTSLPHLPEDGLFTLNRLNKEIENLRSSIRKQQEKRQSIQEKHHPSKEFLVYIKERTLVENMQAKLPRIQEEIREKQYLLKDKKEIEASLVKIRMKEGLSLDQPIPKNWETSEVEKWENNYHSLQQEVKEYEKQVENLTYSIHTYEKNVDQLEEELWTTEEFRLEEAKQEERTTKEQGKMPSSPLLTLGTGIISLALTFFLGGLLQWLSLGTALFSFSLFGLSLVKGKNSNEEIFPSYETFIQQKELRKQWRNQLAHIDAIENEKREFQETLQETKQRVMEIEQSWQAYKKEKSLPEGVTLENTSQKQADYSDYAAEEQKLEKISEQIERINRYLNKQAAYLDFLSSFFPESDQPERKFEYFNHFLQIVTEEEKMKQQYVEKNKEIERTLRQLVAQEKEYVQEKQKVLNQAGADSEDIFRRLYEQQKEKKRKQAKLKMMKENQLVEDGSSYSSLEEVGKERSRYHKQLEEQKVKEKQVTKQKISLDMEIQSLVEGGEYTALLQEFENEKSELQELVDKWVAQKIAASLIKQTLKYAMDDRLPRTIEDAAQYFSYLTDASYQEIFVDQQTVRVVDNTNTTFDAAELSRGTAEPLYVSLRLAFIKNSQDILSVPIIVDDGFVNFDQQRKNKVYTLLKEMSQETQVLFFTFDKESMSGLIREQVTMLQ